MPSRFFSDEELARLECFPAQIPPTDLIIHFTLNGRDRDLLAIRRRPANRLGMALQLCAVRFLGFVPRELNSAPSTAVDFVAEQLALEPSALTAYGRREQTRSDHFAEIRRHLGFSLPGPLNLEELVQWLVSRALEHDKPSLLFHLACEHLRSQRLIRPPAATLARIVGTARNRARVKIYELLEPLLSSVGRSRFDELLATERRGRSILAWLNEGAYGESPDAIKGELAKIAYLRQLGVQHWDLSMLNPNCRKSLAQVGRRATSQALRRMGEQRRYPILAALLHETLIDLVDEVLELYIRALHKADSRSRRQLEDWRMTTAKATNEKVVLFSRLARVILDPSVADEELRHWIFDQIVSREHLAAALEESQHLVRPLDNTHFDFIEQRYGHIRQFAPAVLEAFDFKSLRPDEPLLDALELLRNLNRARRRRIPDDVPVGFVPPKWRPHLIDEKGRIDRHHYELCALFQLRGALRSGDLWIEGSRRYANPASYLIPPERWSSLRLDVCHMLDAPEQGDKRLEELAASIEDLVVRLERALSDSESIRLENDRVVITPHEAEELSEEVLALNEQVAQRLPQIELSDLLIEVDRWTAFSEHFTHAGGAIARNPELTRNLYAAILAQACNFGLTTMAQVSELSYRQLAWTTDWYLAQT